MSKTKVHVLIPYTVVAACGIREPYRNAIYRDRVTCKNCKNTEHYLKLKRWPKERKRV